MWNKPKHQDFDPDVTDHRERYCHPSEGPCTGTSESKDNRDKPKYNRWEEIDDNGHQTSANMHYSTQGKRNDGQNLKDKPFELWGCKGYACFLIFALFIFLVAFTHMVLRF